jgi:polyphosphate kinase 2 (PPK2 family)
LFETAELGRKISKKEFKKQLPELRAELLEAQFALSRTHTSVIVIISGVNAAGRGDVVNVLNEWLDPRGIETISLVSPTDEEKERPHYWRFWRRLPAGGRIGIFFGAWYVEPIEQLVYQRITPAHFDETLVRIRRFETMLVEDGALLLKFWLHLSKDEQHKRLKKLEKDPNTRRSVSQRDWEQAGMYENFTRAVERAIRHTDSGNAPWLLVEANNQRYRDLTVAHTVLENLCQHCPTGDAKSPSTTVIPPEEIPVLPLSATEAPKSTYAKNARTILDTIDLTQRLSRKEYDKELETYQGKLHRLAWEANQKKCSTVIVFEGWDAAGKGGCIRRVTQAMDARLYQTISIAAPTDEERAHHYLWRFWRNIPRAGRVCQ